ncbi:hypothetical protein BCR35DRAFT_307881 [Leucosporidium creatinivorum]|uniref:Uncharacterized protein n=1 Tax=Leucosporidium creatinivorum TaxID=106004 RepID=A0A1Y2EGV5_9BASI|nr:hypothetical protein BCR35DRAFT_307881 [Leucosporidium creatinivorum]
MELDNDATDSLSALMDDSEGVDGDPAPYVLASTASGGQRLPRLPDDVLALIFAPKHFDKVAECVGVSATCRAFYPYGQRLLWGLKGLRVTLGSALLQLQLEAFFDQPRMRPLVKRLRLWLDNTASSDAGRSQRARDMLTTMDDLAYRLSHLESLRLDGPENAQPSLEDILGRAFNFPLLEELELGRWATAANAGRRLPCSLSTVYRAFDVWPSLRSLALDIPLLLDSRTPQNTSLALRHLSFGADFDLPFDAIDHLLSATKPHLTSFAFTGRDALFLDVFTRLHEPGWRLKRLHLGAKSSSPLFNLGVGSQLPTNDLFERFTNAPHPSEKLLGPSTRCRRVLVRSSAYASNVEDQVCGGKTSEGRDGLFGEAVGAEGSARGIGVHRERGEGGGNEVRGIGYSVRARREVNYLRRSPSPKSARPEAVQGNGDGNGVGQLPAAMIMLFPIPQHDRTLDQAS